jgi:hypothetical protein
MITLRDGRKIIGVLRAWDQVRFSPARVLLLLLLRQQPANNAQQYG